MRQFEQVFIGQSGAPMGRDTYGVAIHLLDKTINLFKVRMVDYDYDDGGAYWGAGNNPLWCARDDHYNYRRFVRAASRQQAADLLEIPDCKLKVRR